MKPPTSHAQEALIFSTAEFAVLLPECLYFPCPLLISILSCYSNTLQLLSPGTLITAILGDRPVGHMSQGALFLVISNR